MSIGNPLTERELRYIEKLKSYGWGYAEFARNVESQGWCSPAQLEAMERMHVAVSHRRSLFASRNRCYRYTAKPNELWQAYATFYPPKGRRKCDNYLPVRRTK